MIRTDAIRDDPSPLSAATAVKPLDSSASVEQASVIFSCATAPAILETSLGTGTYARYSVLAADPMDSVVHWRQSDACPFQRLQAALSAYPSLAIRPQYPFFGGGWIGHLSYEAGLTIEGITCHTERDDRVPLVALHLYDSAAVYDHVTGQWYAVAVDWPMPWRNARPAVGARWDVLEHQLAQAEKLDWRLLPTPGVAAPAAVECNMSDAAYLAKAARAKEYIAAGDVFQVNLTRRFSTRTRMTPIETFRQLQRVNPSSHAAMLTGDGYAVLSSSPELFLQVRGTHVVTRPIKGTRPREDNARGDAAARRDLEASEKDRAELNMIIDLLRNDLGRVCRYGSIRVSSDGEIEAHPTVFHRVATIEGELDEGKTPLDLIRATFPGGSVTGAPKIRAIQIIDELEPTERGVYCGSIGYIGLDGSMSLNIAIRTMVQMDDIVHIYAGGAIVADSVPDEEHAEILAKGRGMFQALGCIHPSLDRTLEPATI